MNKILSITRNIIPYVKELRKINEVKSSSDAILMQQLDYWFSKSDGKPFYKFTSPPEQQNPFYKEGDSWCEELSFSIDEFRTAFSHIGIKYSSKKEFEAAKNSDIGIFQGSRFYAAYTDKMKYITYYYRNNELVDYILSGLINGEYQSTEAAIANLRKQALPIYVNGENQSTEIGNPNPELYTDITTNNNTNTTNISGEQVAHLHSAAFSNSNQATNNELENEKTAAPKTTEISLPLNISKLNEEEGAGGRGAGAAKETFFEGKTDKHLQTRMGKLITTKQHKNLLAPIYEKAHKENGFKPLSNEQQNNVFAKFLAKSFVELKYKDGNYLLPTLRENKPFLCKLIELFESVEWQKKTWKAIELQAKSLIAFDSSPDFCITLIDKTLKGSAQTGSVYLQFYYDLDKTKVMFDAYVKNKQAMSDGQNGNVLGNSFTRNGKTIVFAKTYTKERSNERFGMYEGVEYCLTHNGAWLVPTKDNATLQNDVEEWNKTGVLRGLINSKGV